jgi:hypothetical protein
MKDRRNLHPQFGGGIPDLHRATCEGGVEVVYADENVRLTQKKCRLSFMARMSVP